MWLFDFLFKREPSPVYNGKISGETVRTLLCTPTTRILDRHYTGISIDSFIDFAKFSTISNQPYIPETHDCDDFSFAFFVEARKWAPGVPVGIVIGNTVNGTPHAWNCFVDGQNRKVYYFEPQEDVMFTPTTENVWEIII